MTAEQRQLIAELASMEKSEPDRMNKAVLWRAKEEIEFLIREREILREMVPRP